MSTIKTDALTAATGTNTDLDLSGKGTGVPDIAAGFKVGGTAGVPVSELRAGTDGELITWDASGDAATVAVGTATHVLTSNGAGAAPTFQEAGGGAWSVKSSGTVSAGSELAITSVTKTTQVWVDGIVGTDGASLRGQTSTDGGSTYDDGGSDYYNVAVGSKANSSTPYAEVSTYSAFQLIQRTGSAAGESFAGYITVHNPSATHYTNISTNFATSENTGDLFWQWQSWSQRISAADVDAFKIYPSSGTFTISYVVLELN